MQCISWSDILPLRIAFYQLCLICLPKNMVPKNLWFLWFIIFFLIQVAIEFGVPNLQGDPCSPAHVRHVILGMVVVCGYRFIIGCSDQCSWGPWSWNFQPCSTAGPNILKRMPVYYNYYSPFAFLGPVKFWYGGLTHPRMGEVTRPPLLRAQTALQTALRGVLRG